jgi:hypothetical protein
MKRFRVFLEILTTENIEKIEKKIQKRKKLTTEDIEE